MSPPRHNHDAIADLKAQGVSYSAIAKKIGCGLTTVGRALRNRNMTDPARTGMQATCSDDAQPEVKRLHEIIIEKRLSLRKLGRMSKVPYETIEGWMAKANNPRLCQIAACFRAVGYPLMPRPSVHEIPTKDLALELKKRLADQGMALVMKAIGDQDAR